LQTRSGTKVLLNDAAGSVFVEDKDGNSMMMDGAGNITVKSKILVHVHALEEIKFETKKITMQAENLIEMRSKELDGYFKEKSVIFGQELCKVHSAENAEVYSQQAVSVKGETHTAVKGKGGVSVDSEKGQVYIEGNLATTLLGGKIGINCQA